MTSMATIMVIVLVTMFKTLQTFEVHLAEKLEFETHQNVTHLLVLCSLQGLGLPQ